MKRTSIIRKQIHGGLNMLDIDSFLLSLKAVWVNRLQNAEGKWSDIFKLNIRRTKLDADYMWKTSFRSVDDLRIITNIPKFYQEVLLAFNKAKYIKPFYLLNKHEVMEQPI